MQKLKTLGLLLLPVGAIIASSSVASADRLLAEVQNPSFFSGDTTYDCNAAYEVNGTRAHLQATAIGNTTAGLFTAVATSTSSGTSATYQLPKGVTGISHFVRVESGNVGGPFGNPNWSFHIYPPQSPTVGWVTNGNTNLGQTSVNVVSAVTAQHNSGTCILHQILGYSAGNRYDAAP